MEINRKTDSFFDWLGDWGGLLDGLTLIVEIIVNAYQRYALKIKVAWLFVRHLPSRALNKKTRKKSDLKKAAFDEKFTDSINDPKRKNIAQNII